MPKSPLALSGGGFSLCSPLKIQWLDVISSGHEVDQVVEGVRAAMDA